MNWDWGLIEAIAKAVGIIIGIAAGGYQAYKLGVRGFQARAALKRDLEILKMLDESDPCRIVLKDHVDRVVKRLYAPSAPSIWSNVSNWQPKDWPSFILGVVLFMVFAGWTAYLSVGGFSWWSLLTGFFAL